MRDTRDIDMAREWLLAHQHATHVRCVLERALEYADALDRAGICLKSVDGEDLYQFLTAVEAQEARRATLTEATL